MKEIRCRFELMYGQLYLIRLESLPEYKTSFIQIANVILENSDMESLLFGLLPSNRVTTMIHIIDNTVSEFIQW